jgi:general secretion pathway protein K
MLTTQRSGHGRRDVYRADTAVALGRQRVRLTNEFGGLSTLIVRLRSLLSSSRGIALVAVLWAVVLLSALAASFISTARTTTALAHNQVEAAQATAIAEGGVFRTIAGLIVRSNSRSPRTAQIDEAAVLVEAEGNALPADPALWRTDGTAYRWRYADAELLISIQAEDGKIDLNAAPNDLLKALLVSSGVDEGRATALARSRGIEGESGSE